MQGEVNLPAACLPPAGTAMLPAAAGRPGRRLTASPVVEEAPALHIVPAGSWRQAAVRGQLPLPAAAGGVVGGRRQQRSAAAVGCRRRLLSAPTLRPAEATVLRLSAVGGRRRVTGSGRLP